MCKIGDIIVVKKYKSQGKTLEHHSFIVLDDNNGNIRGLNFDFVSLVMSSFHNEKHKKFKMKFDGNFPIVPDDQDIIGGDNGKSGFVKTEQFYYFNKDKIDYQVIGCIQPDIFELIVEYIEELKIPIIQVTDNL